VKAAAIGGAVVWIWCVALAPVVTASGGHGGGHSGGGHSSGGHAAAGGHAAGGHVGGHTRGSATSGGTAAPRTTGSTHTTTGGTTTGRPRDGRPIVGTAVTRAAAKSTPLGVSPSTLPLYHSRPSFGMALGFGGLGFYTDPFLFGYTYSGFAYLPGYSGYPALAPYPFEIDGPTGGLRLKVEPKEAQVYVDGYYAGLVDDFNGHFQHLDMTAGPHHVEIRAPGYEPLAFDMTIQAHHTTEYRGALSRSLP
jgi:PEGA domain